MNRNQNRKNRGKTIIIAALCILFAGAVLLIAAGVKGMRSAQDSTFAGDDVWQSGMLLKAEAEELYQKTLQPALERADEAVRAGAASEARKLLAEAFATDEDAIAGDSDEAVYEMLAMTYACTKKKISSGDRKELAKYDANQTEDHLLKLIASGGAVADDDYLGSAEALQGADTSFLMQVLFALRQDGMTVLGKDNALAFRRAAGNEDAIKEAVREIAGGGVSPLMAWIIKHARTVILAGVLLLIDVVLLFFLLLSDRSWRMDFKWILILVIVDFLLFFQLLPLIYLLVKAVFPDGSFSLETLTRLYTYKMNWQALRNTMIASLATMVLGTAIAFPLAWLVGRTNVYGRAFFRRLFVVTYMVPPYVGAMAWLRLLNKNVGTVNLVLRKVFSLGITEGPLNIYTLAGLIWVLTTFYYPYAFITISRSMEKMDPTLEEASRVSGAGAFVTLFRITFPMMLPSLMAGALLVFISAASCYGIPSIIGAPGNVHTVTTRIVQYFGIGVQGINDATGLAVFLIAAAILVMLLSEVVVGKRQYVTVSGKSTRPNIVDLRRLRIPFTILLILFSLIAVVIPFLTILGTSFKVDVGKTLLAPGNFTWAQWKTLMRGETVSCLVNSLLFGAAAATAGIAISCTMSYLLQRTTIRGRQIPNFLITLGSGTPSVVIALGLILTMRGQFGANLYGTAAILIIAYLVKYLMMGMRTVTSAMSQIHVSLEECSQISGASWLKTMLKITGPLIFPSIAAGWFLIFIPSFYELSMTTLLYSDQTKTIGYQLYEYWTLTSQPQACAMASGILLFIVLLNFVLNRLTKGEFSI